MISTLRTCRLESTMFLFCYTEYHERCYGSSTHLEVKASPGFSVVRCHLKIEIELSAPIAYSNIT